MPVNNIKTTVPFIRITAFMVGVVDCGYSLMLSCAFFCCTMPATIGDLSELVSLASIGGIGVMGAQLCIIVYNATKAKWAWWASWIGLILSVGSGICAYRLDVELQNIEAKQNSGSYEIKDDRKQSIRREIERLEAEKLEDIKAFRSSKMRTKAIETAAKYDKLIAVQESKLDKLQAEIEEKDQAAGIISRKNPSPELILNLIAADTVAALRLDQKYQADIKRFFIYLLISGRSLIIDLTGPRLIAFALGFGFTSVAETTAMTATLIGAIKHFIVTISVVIHGWITTLMSSMAPLKRRQKSATISVDDAKLNITTPRELTTPPANDGLTTPETTLTKSMVCGKSKIKLAPLPISETTNNESKTTPQTTNDELTTALTIVKLIQSLTKPTKTDVARKIFGVEKPNQRHMGIVVDVANRHGVKHLLHTRGSRNNGKRPAG